MARSNGAAAAVGLDAAASEGLRAAAMQHQQQHQGEAAEEDETAQPQFKAAEAKLMKVSGWGWGLHC